MFVGPNGKVGKKVHFGAIWSSFGHGIDSLHMEQGGWTNLKSKEARNMLQIWRNKFKTKKIRKEQETWNIIQTTLSYRNLIQPYLILSYPNLLLP